MCGIYAILESSNIIHKLINGLFHLQHRGQESSGICILDNKNNYIEYKSFGLLKKLITDDIYNIKGNIGIGHVRYSTNTNQNINSIQPFTKNNITMCYNGNIHNVEEIFKFLSDKIILKRKDEAYVFFKLIEYYINRIRQTSDIIKFIKQINNICKGAYSVILYIKDIGLISFKDKFGLKPLLYSIENTNKDNFRYSISSESCSLNKNGFNNSIDLYNNEIIYINIFNDFSIKKYTNINPYSPCIFEYIYVSRVDSIFNNVSIYKARYNMGLYLAKKIEKLNIKFDYIIPIPDTSKVSAMAISEYLGVQYKEIIIKNRYISRTFIMNSNKERNLKLKLKFSIIKSIVKNKNVLIIDDSIVRGNTIRHVSNLFKNEEVNKIVVASCSPEIRYQNKYGIDIKSREELLLNKMEKSEILKYLNIDDLIFQDINDLILSVTDLNNNLTNFDLSIFNGIYIS